MGRRAQLSSEVNKNLNKQSKTINQILVTKIS